MRQAHFEGMQVQCEKHDKIYIVGTTTCPGCDTAAGEPGGIPLNVDTPYLSSSGGTSTLSGAIGEPLHCTKGNWEGTPTSYSYNFQANGVSVQLGALDTYTPVATDAGKSIVCLVTATNAFGATLAPPSNAVDVL